jgi:hypothetical protein
MMTTALPTWAVLSSVVVKNVGVQTPRVAPPPRAASGTNALDVQDRQHELIYDCPQPTPMMLVLHIHYSRASDIIIPDHVATTRSLPCRPTAMVSARHKWRKMTWRRVTTIALFIPDFAGATLAS